MSDDPEIELIGLLESGLQDLDDKARRRVINWAISWVVEKSGAASSARRVTAFDLAASAITALHGEDRRAIIDAINAIEPRPIVPRPPLRVVRSVPPFPKVRRPKHCSKCGKTGHDKRFHRKPKRVERTELLEME